MGQMGEFNREINIIISANITTYNFRVWNRKNIKNYFEVYIESQKKILKSRDYKNLYKNILQKKIKNVVGIDIPFMKPKGCNLYLKNNKSKKNFEKNYFKILKLLQKKKFRIF